MRTHGHTFQMEVRSSGKEGIRVLILVPQHLFLDLSNAMNQHVSGWLYARSML